MSYTDLADLYGVTVKRLNEQVKRNLNRFPRDFMFHLNEEEHQSLKSHFATLKKGRGHPAVNGPAGTKQEEDRFLRE
jgi:ORF6N domain